MKGQIRVLVEGLLLYVIFVGLVVLVVEGRNVAMKDLLEDDSKDNSSRDDDEEFKLHGGWDSSLIKVEVPTNYSVHLPPPLIQGDPVPVKLSLLVFNVFDIKEMQGEISLEANLKLYWKDMRLANLTGTLMNLNEYVVLSPSFINQIWNPDVFIDHMKGMSQPSLISKPASLRLYPDGSIRYSARVLITMSCLMDFHYYPADIQNCPIDFKSYAYSTHHITLAWKDNKGPVFAYPVILHNFDVALGSGSNYLQVTRSASYAGITFTLSLRRKLSYHIIQTFVPSALFTIVSWLSFLVPPDSTPGRMSLCVTTLLTLTAMFAAVRNSTPSVSYIKALDLWMVTCIIFVFSVLAEYTIVLKLRSMKERQKKVGIVNKVEESRGGVRGSLRSNKSLAMDLEYDNSSNAACVSLISSSRPLTPAPVTEKQTTTKYARLAHKLEIHVPRMMPLLFLLFNFIYWPYLLGSGYYEFGNNTEMFYSV